MIKRTDSGSMLNLYKISEVCGIALYSADKRTAPLDTPKENKYEAAKDTKEYGSVIYAKFE